MPFCRIACAVAVGLMLCRTVEAQSGPSSSRTWMTDPRAAVAEARRLDLPLLMHFYADWCGPCKRMEQEFLSSPAVVEQFGKRFIGLKLNSDHHADIAKELGVESLPTDLFIDPTGKVLAQTTGYQDARTYLTRMARIDTRYAQDRKVQFAKTRTSEPVTASPASRSPALARIDDQRSDADLVPRDAPVQLVGLSGYSPVALYNGRRWEKGKREFAGMHEGILYYMTSPAEQDEFNQAPAKYAPRLLGCDPVVLAETQRAIPGTTRFAAYCEGELFLFVSSATRDKFKQDPPKYVRLQQVLRLDQLETELR